MSAKSILTKRELKNKVTGIDLMVPDFEETHGKLTKSAMYHVIVITRLFYYKSPRHKESDIVQFMIKKKYEEFEDLYQKLNARFPSVILPNLPKKPLLMNSGTFQERRKVMDDVMHLVARTQKLCCSPMVLEFLGVGKPKRPALETMTVSEEIFDEKKPSESPTEPEDVENTDQNAAEKEEPDLFTAVDLDSSASLQTEQEDTFTATKTGKLELHASLFEDEVEKLEQGNRDDSDLFIPADAKVDQKQTIDLDENTDGLLDSVEEDVDDLLALSQKSERKSSIKASSKPPARTKLSSRTSFESAKADNDDDDDLSLLASSNSEATNKQKQQQEADFFSEARKKPLKDPKKETLDKSDTLDDIFAKGSGDKNLFSKHTTDDDLFVSNTSTSKSTTTTTAAVDENLDQDDIMKYINDNINQDVDDLQL